MGDLQALPASLREKQRYLIVDIVSDGEFGLGEVVDAVWDAVLDLLGEQGAAEADPWVVKDLFDRERQRAGIRVHKDRAEAVRAALALITAIDGRDAVIHVQGVTGTMESARKKYL